MPSWAKPKMKPKQEIKKAIAQSKKPDTLEDKLPPTMRRVSHYVAGANGYATPVYYEKH